MTDETRGGLAVAAASVTAWGLLSCAGAPWLLTSLAGCFVAGGLVAGFAGRSS